MQNVVRAKQKEAENVKVVQKDPDAVEKVHRRSAALRRNVQVSPVFQIKIIRKALELDVSEIKVLLLKVLLLKESQDISDQHENHQFPIFVSPS